MFGSFDDKLYFVAFLFTVFTVAHGYIKLDALNIYGSELHLSREQSDRLIIGMFHTFLIVAGVCFLL